MIKLQNISFSKTNWPLVFILCLSAVTRFWRFWDLNFMHDELSALSRLHYDSFADFIHFGIRVDGHPAGIQFLLKGLNYFFGNNPFLLKLPFMLMGIGSIYLIYKLGEKWFNKTSGLFSAALLVCTQHTVFYDTIIRPYGPGLFGGLWVTLVWTKIIFTNARKWSFYVGFGTLIALLTYIHYFALLYGVLLFFTSFLWISKSNYLRLAVSGIIALLLFTPHLEIFFYQFGIGGIGGSRGWLKPAERSFFTDYLYYVFNHSLWFVGYVFIVVILNFELRGDQAIKKRISLLLLFIFPILIGFFYSIYRNPVLQVSVLLFSFPAFILFLSSFVKLQSSKIMIVLIGIVGFATLHLFLVMLIRIVSHLQLATIRSVKKSFTELGRSSLF